MSCVLFLEPHKNRGKPRNPLPRKAYENLREKLYHEYELYSFIRQRLKKQERKLKLWRIHKTGKRQAPVEYHPKGKLEHF